MTRTNGVEFSATQRKSRTSARCVTIELNFQQDRVRQILEAIRSCQCSTVRSLADDLNLSPSYVQHFFKSQTGLRLGHLLVEQRLQRAAELLKNSNLRIKEIACAVGYEHTSSFIRAFEHRFKQPPLEYRRHNLRIVAIKSPQMLINSWFS